MISYIRGYYIITVEGIGIERFLNNLIRNGINVYNVTRISNTKIQLYIDRSDIKLFRQVYRGSNFDIKVKQKTGIPFLMKRIYKYKGMWICAILSLFLLMLTSQFVTDIYIKSPEGIREDDLRRELYEAGLKPGVYKKSIDRKEIRDTIMAEFDEVAYVSINVKGTNIFVTITKKAESLKSTEQSNYCNIIAKKDGIIEEIIPRSGNPAVDVGYIAHKGDVLINGANTKSIPEVWASTFYEVKKSASYIETKKEKTGNKKSVYTISLYDEKFTIRRKIKYKDYIIENKEHKFTIGNYTFPIRINVSTFYEANKIEVKKDKNTLKKELAASAKKEMEYIMPASAKFINAKEDYNVNKGILEYSLVVTMRENIAELYNLTKAQAEQFIKDQKPEEGEEEVPSNPEKRPINDIRNEFIEDKDKKADSEEKKEQ